MSNNQLTGPIPHSLGSCVALETLTLDNNQLTGPIPDSLGSCVALKTLWLHNNQLTGPIPDLLGSCVALEALTLDNNQLTGPIPDSLEGCVALKTLSLHNNQLTGSVPDSLRSCVVLETLVFHNATSARTRELRGEVEAEEEARFQQQERAAIQAHEREMVALNERIRRAGAAAAEAAAGRPSATGGISTAGSSEASSPDAWQQRVTALQMRLTALRGCCYEDDERRVQELTAVWAELEEAQYQLALAASRGPEPQPQQPASGGSQPQPQPGSSRLFGSVASFFSSTVRDRAGAAAADVAAAGAPPTPASDLDPLQQRVTELQERRLTLLSGDDEDEQQQERHVFELSEVEAQLEDAQVRLAVAVSQQQPQQLPQPPQQLPQPPQQLPQPPQQLPQLSQPQPQLYASFTTGQSVLYAQQDGTRCLATVRAVMPGSVDDPEPSYTVALRGGIQRDTIAARLTASSPDALQAQMSALLTRVSALQNPDGDEDDEQQERRVLELTAVLAELEEAQVQLALATSEANVEEAEEQQQQPVFPPVEAAAAGLEGHPPARERAEAQAEASTAEFLRQNGGQGNAYDNNELRMCRRCRAGPVENRCCNDLASHNGEDGGGINCCRSCGWFSPNYTDWLLWDGVMGPH